MSIGPHASTWRLCARGVLAVGAGMLVYVGLESGFRLWAPEPGSLRDNILGSGPSLIEHISFLLSMTAIVTCQLVGVRREGSPTRQVCTALVVAVGCGVLSGIATFLLA